MRIYRKFFISIIACGFLLGCIFFIRLQLNNGTRGKPAAPEFLPNVVRFRTSRVCSPRALVLVISSPKRSYRRQVIRETWAHPTTTQPLDISVAFGVGTADSTEVQRALDWEAEIYGDIFQDSSVDNGAGSASRVVQLLKAARSACTPLPEFVLKTDDDVFVNIHSVAELLEILETHSDSNTMWCLEWNRQLDKIGQSNNNTWVALWSESGDGGGRPRYCVGTVYLMTGRALKAIIRRDDFQNGKTLLPEDVYVTGMLAKEAGTGLSLLGERFAFNDQFEEVDAGKVTFAHLGDRFEDSMSKLWRSLAKEQTNDDGRRKDVGL